MAGDIVMESSRIDGCVVLVLEDEPLVGLEIAELLSSAGAQVKLAGTLADAMASVDGLKISAAIVDINLGGQDCSVLCTRLSQRRIPFVFYTGYTAAPDGWSTVPIISKPASGELIVKTIERLCRSHQAA
jgi:DNA-binding response OmpR family regulator